MDNRTKITLSDPELDKVTDTEWILTKHRIIDKVYAIFSACAGDINGLLANPGTSLPTEALSVSPRIFKGENYLQLPYVIMDYPAVFGKKDVFALRTMFWWGNFFSITLQLSGKYKDQFIPKVVQQLKTAPAGFYLCVNDHAWQHHFEADNYLPSNEMLIQQLPSKSFVKVALRYDLKHWNNMPQLLHEGYERILRLMGD